MHDKYIHPVGSHKFTKILQYEIVLDCKKL